MIFSLSFGQSIFVQNNLIYIQYKTMQKQNSNSMSSKCQHNCDYEKFCLKADCPHPEIGGCSQCFTQKSDPSHTHDLIFPDQLNSLMKKFIFPKKVKPNCTQLQQAFYYYFEKLKQEIQNVCLAIEEIEKGIVNKIGYPFIYSHNHFNVFKRLRNKEYKRINSAEFRSFVNQARSTSGTRLAELEESIYFQSVYEFFQATKSVNQAMEIFQNIVGKFAKNSQFSHGKEAYAKIEKLIEGIHPSPKKVQKHSSINQQSTQPKVIISQTYSSNSSQNRNKPPSLGLKNLSSQLKEKKEKKPEHHPLRKRRNSIDNQLTKLNKLESKVEEIRRKGKQKEQKNTEEDSISSDKEIKNYNLPNAEVTESRVIEKCEVKPITRKLEEDHVNVGDEISSPLLKKKKLKNSLKNSSEGKRQSPYVIQSPEKRDQIPFTNSFIIPKKVECSLPPLNERQENSLLLLTASLKLETKQAIPLLQAALTQCNENLSAAEYLSYLYLEANEAKKCLDLCNDYLEKISQSSDLQSSYYLLLNNKGAALNLLGRFSETVKILENLSHKSEMTLKNLGNSYYGLGFFDEAIPLYKRALEDCNDDEVYYNLSACLFIKGNYTMAKMTLHSALASQPNKAEYIELQTQIMKRIKDH